MNRDHQERDPRFRLNREATVCWDCHGYVVGSQSKSVFFRSRTLIEGRLSFLLPAPLVGLHLIPTSTSVMEESIDLTIVIRCEKLISKHLRLESCPRLVE